ncbi:MAG TPA: hypothetical protein VJQ43_02310, partial [Thermoplasmata archaeon]|nr:hypothetical protein [Thermoplasmata archaeon]
MPADFEMSDHVCGTTPPPPAEGRAAAGAPPVGAARKAGEAARWPTLGLAAPGCAFEWPAGTAEAAEV